MNTSVKKFGNSNGGEVLAYTLENEYLSVTVLNYGATIQSVRVKTPSGPREITLGYDDMDGYILKSNYFGATIGRVANRISGGAFTLGGKKYALDKNDGDNCLHGGFNGYDKRIFSARAEDNRLEFTLKSCDGDQGFPAELLLKVEYVLQNNSLKITYTAQSDGETLWNPTNHTFFNLSGKCGNVYDTELKINAEKFTPVNQNLVPSGELAPVGGTVFDFRDYKKIGQSINSADRQLQLVSGGYDHNFVLSGEHAATAKCSGLKMEVYTDLPGLQLYTGNFLDGVSCRGGIYGKHTAFCLEPQYFPNAVNTEGFEKPLLRKGETKTHYIKYTFLNE